MKKTLFLLGTVVLLFSGVCLSCKNDSDEEEEESVYALLNIPYEEFYASEGVGNKTQSDTSHVNVHIDALSSATNKVGNFGKSGGGYHSKATAQINEDGTITAVGGTNGAVNEGVTWPVKAPLSVIKSLGGTEITDETQVTVATVGRGSTSSTALKGFASITESKQYSYYVLPSEPAFYKELTVSGGKASYSQTKGTATQKTVEAEPKYDDSHATLVIKPAADEEISALQINAVVVTTEDASGNTVSGGLVHISDIWAYGELGLDGLEGTTAGQTVKNIRIYANNSKAVDNTFEGAASDLVHYVYDLSTDVTLTPIALGVSASFESATAVRIAGLPSDIKDVKAIAYSGGGRGAAKAYIAGGEDSTVAVSESLITTSVATSGTEYTIVITSTNYAPITVKATYTAAS